ncbi:MAG: ComEC/Rec2 family competence protein [Minisyncoccia bacterium]
MNKSYSKAKIFRLSGVAFLFGIILSYVFTFKVLFLVFLILFLIFVFLFIFFRKRIPLAVIFFIIFSLIFGFLRYKKALNFINYPIEISKLQDISFEVVLSEELENYQKLTVKVYGLKTLFGGIIYTDLKPAYFKGEIIKVNKGKFEKITNPYYANGLFIFFKINYPFISKIQTNKFLVFFSILKNKIKNIFNNYLLQPQSSLLTSLVFGKKGNLNKDLEEELNLSGLSHLVAVSGLHLVILTEIIVDFLNNFSLNRFIRALILLSLLLFFALLSGFTPSITRALIMALLLVFAELNFRLYHPLNALIFTALIMTFSNPFILIYDFGFQLSFLATLGIILLTPIFRKTYFLNQSSFKFLRNFQEAFFSSLSALIFVYPWLIFKTGNISVLSLISNTLVVPFIPYVLILALILILFNFFYFPALFFGWLLNFCLTYILIIVRMFSSLKFFIISFPFKIRPIFLLFYIFLIFYYLKYKKEQLFIKENI